MHFVGFYYIVRITVELNVRCSISVKQTQQERPQDEVASSLLPTGKQNALYTICTLIICGVEKGFNVHVLVKRLDRLFCQMNGEVQCS
jgi:hypothetical protein